MAAVGDAAGSSSGRQITSREFTSIITLYTGSFVKINTIFEIGCNQVAKAGHAKGGISA